MSIVDNEVVVAVGFEPTFRVFSSLLIVAFHCTSVRLSACIYTTFYLV
jgi:hypothetical protein